MLDTITAPYTAQDHFLLDLIEGMGELIDEQSMSFHDFVKRHNPTLLEYEHIPRLIRVAQRVADGDLNRVIIMEPPRYFKTELFSRLLPAYYLRRFPARMVGLSSYGAELAWSISEEARDYYTMDGGRLSPSTTAKKRWRTTRDGQIFAAGAGGPILGFGYHLGIVDDPQDPEKAHSYTFQQRFEDWWRRKWMSRAEPGAAVLVVMQRLGPSDAIDFLLRSEVGDDTDLAPENWHVVLCDEIKSAAPVGEWEGPLGLPPTCTLEPDDRAIGEVLAPSRMSRDQVLHAQTSAGTYTAATQRQQRPTVPKGDFWHESWFVNVYDKLPDTAYNLGWDWDLAYSKEEHNSASAGVRTARGPGKADECIIYVEDITWDWLEFPELIKLMLTKTGPHYIEGKASGKSAQQTLQREGISAKTVGVPADKLARATAVQPVVSNLRVHVNRRVLRSLLKGDRQGLLTVRGENLARNRGDLDLNDAFVQAITRHVGRRRRRRARAHVVGGAQTTSTRSTIELPTNEESEE